MVSTPQITLQPNEARGRAVHRARSAALKPGQYLAGVERVGAAVAPTSQAKQGRRRVRPASRWRCSSSAASRSRSTCPGPRAPKLAVTGAEPKATPDGVAARRAHGEPGNAFAHGNGVIRVADTKTDFSFKIDTFVPGTAIVYPMPWTKTVVPGTHHVQVDLTYEGGRRTSWNGTVVIAGDTQNRAREPRYERDGEVAGRGSFPVLDPGGRCSSWSWSARLVFMRRRSRARARQLPGCLTDEPRWTVLRRRRRHRT